MKFRYIINTEDGDFLGTNDRDVALYFEDGGALAMDVKEGKLLSGSPVEEAEAPPPDEDEDEEEAA